MTNQDEALLEVALPPTRVLPTGKEEDWGWPLDELKRQGKKLWFLLRSEEDVPTPEERAQQGKNKNLKLPISIEVFPEKINKNGKVVSSTKSKGPTPEDVPKKKRFSPEILNLPKRQRYSSF